MNSTRALWDPTYTDPNFPQPNYSTDSNYTSSCTVPLQAPQIIPMMHSWLTSGWTGHLLRRTRNVNRRVQLRRNRVDQRRGHAGRCSRHLRQIWTDHGRLLADNNVFHADRPQTWPSQIYRNYDGSKSTFGDQALNSTTGDQSHLAVYAASRTSDGAMTIVVINKTYGPLTDTPSINNLTSTATRRRCTSTAMRI